MKAVAHPKVLYIAGCTYLRDVLGNSCYKRVTYGCSESRAFSTEAPKLPNDESPLPLNPELSDIDSKYMRSKHLFNFISKSAILTKYGVTVEGLSSATAASLAPTIPDKVVEKTKIGQHFVRKPIPVKRPGKTKESRDGESNGKPVRNPRSAASEIEEMISKLPSAAIFSKVLPTYKRRCKSDPDGVHLVDESFADKIIEAMMPSIARSGPDTIFLEGSAGFGFLSKRLLEAGVQRLRTFESCDHMRCSLHALQHQFGSRMDVMDMSLSSLHQYTFMDMLDGGSRASKVLEGIRQRAWDEDPSVVVFFPGPPLLFIHRLLHSFIFQEGLMQHGRPELYLLLDPYMYLRITSRSKDNFVWYRAIAVLFQIIFKIENIGSLPRNLFIPWRSSSSVQGTNRLCVKKNIDPDRMIIVRLSPHRDLFSRLDINKLREFNFFVRHHFVARKRKIIPALEKWNPGCGSHLLDHGYTADTIFGSQTPDQMLWLFNQFTSWPGYEDSSFTAAVESSSMMKLNDDSDLDSILEGYSETELKAEEEDAEEFVVHNSNFWG